MPFESLSFRSTLELADLPHRWLPLLHPYDQDLPLFPIYYFHGLSPALALDQRPRAVDRVFGYVERIIPRDSNGIAVKVVSSKDVSLPENQGYKDVLEAEVRARFGLIDPVKITDVSNAFRADLKKANPVLTEMWHRVIAGSYGDALPFGRTWDEILGLARFVASWNSQGGRKGEFIQTHYFSSRFGQRVGASEGIPQMDFFLLPTLAEVLDRDNPLTDFPRFRNLLSVASRFAESYGVQKTVGDVRLTAFRKPEAGRFNTQQLLKIINGAAVPHDLRGAAIECFNAFGKGPQRTVLFLLMLRDLRDGNMHPDTLTSSQFGSIYDGFANSYQSPKVVAIYAQQCFGNPDGMPVDTWIKTLMQWPLTVYPQQKSRKLAKVFEDAVGLGKVERLLWIASQARKVHSSACDDALWCVKYGSSAKKPTPRGANPFACNICLEAIRNRCPAYAAIRDRRVFFNAPAEDEAFRVDTSAGNNATANQTFVRCTGKSIYASIIDEFSPADDPTGFNTYPAAGHDGAAMTVAEFVRKY